MYPNGNETQMVPVDRWVNKKGQLVILTSFDTANSTEDCMLQIKRRHQDMKDQKSGPIRWSNTEYIGPMTVFGLLCLISIGIHCLLWAKNRPRSGPRQRQDVEMN